MNKDLVISVLNTQLVEHPQNMRRIYRLARVRAMALSQAARAARGQPPCTQPLIVTPGPGISHYDSKSTPRLTVIAGHLRLRGNRYLGEKAPRLNVIVRFYTDDAEMLADMSTENGVRDDPGPVSWALHFQLQLSNGRNLREVARDAGKSVDTVRSLLQLLALGAEAQRLIDEGQLAVGAASQLRRIGEARLQARAARRFARARTPLGQMKLVVDHLLDPTTPSVYASRGKGRKDVRLAPPEETLKEAEGPGRTPALNGLPGNVPATLGDLRDSARLTCAGCAIAGQHGQREAAWHLATAASGAVCQDCNLRLVKDACQGCPLPEMLSRVVRSVAGRRPTSAQAVVALEGLNA